MNLSKEEQNQVYKEYIRQRYNKYRHQNLRMTEGMILQKIIREWKYLNPEEKMRLFQIYRDRKILTQSIQPQEDQNKVQSKPETLTKREKAEKKLKKKEKTTKRRQKNKNEEDLSDSMAIEPETVVVQQKKELELHQDSIIHNNVAVNQKVIEPTPCLSPQKDVVHAIDLKDESKENVNNFSFGTENISVQSLNKSILLVQSAEMACQNTNLSHLKNQQPPQFSQQPLEEEKVNSNKDMNEPFEFSPIKRFEELQQRKLTTEQQIWEKQIDQNSLKKLLSFTIKFQEPPQCQKKLKTNEYLIFYKKKFSQIKDCFPKLRTNDITKVVKDLWIEQKKSRKERMQNQSQEKIRMNSKMKTKSKYKDPDVKEQKEIKTVQSTKPSLNEQMDNFFKEKPQDFPEQLWKQLKRDPQKFLRSSKRIST